MAAGSGPAGRFLVGLLDRGDVAEIDRSGVVPKDHHLLEIFGALKSARRPDPNVALALLDSACGKIDIGRGDGFAKLGVADSPLRHRVRIDQNVQFRLPGTANADLRNARHPIESRLHASLHEIVERRRIEIGVR